MTDPNNPINDYPDEEPEFPGSLEELLDKIEENPALLKSLKYYFIDVYDIIEDNLDRAEAFYYLVQMGWNKIPIETYRDLIFRTVKAFPRLRGAMHYLFDVCSDVFCCEQSKNPSYNFRFNERLLPYLEVILMLSSYSKEKTERILHNTFALNREEEQVVEDLNEICGILDNLFIGWETAKYKKELYYALCTRIDPPYAAVIAITLAQNMPSSSYRNYYMIKGAQDFKDDYETDENDEYDFFKTLITGTDANELMDENERLKKEIAALKEEIERQLMIINKLS